MGLSAPTTGYRRGFGVALNRIPGALASFRRNWYSLLLVGVLMAFDQLTKVIAAATLQSSPHSYLNGLLRLDTPRTVARS